MNGLIVGRVWAGAGGAGMYLGYVEQNKQTSFSYNYFWI
jgi:hypothetical protein